MSKSNHQVKVVRIPEILPHPNADTLGLVIIPGTSYQCVVKKDHWKTGELGIYIQPDSIVPQAPQYEFLWVDKEFPDGIVPEKYRRVTVRRFRKSWSEGLLLPVSEFYAPGAEISMDEGDDVSDLLAITHYEPPEPEDHTVTRKQQYKWPPKSLRGWFYYLLHLIGIDLNGQVGGSNEKGPKNPPPVYDVEAFKNFKGSFEAGEQVVVTEKIHGSNARFMFDGKKMFVGSRKLWKSAKSNCIWRKALEQHPWIEKRCRQWPGQTVYGEVFPTQGGFNYGMENGKVGFRGFDLLTADGRFVPVYEFADLREMIAEPVDTWVPVLYEGPFDEEVIKKLVDGPSTLPGSKNIREGVVVRPVQERSIHGLGRLQLKLVSNAFLEKQ